MSSDSESDNENYYEMKKRMIRAHAQEMNIMYLSASTIFGKYCDNWVMKANPRTSILSGFGWLQETIGTPGETFTMLRMKATVFFELHDLLKDKYGLGHSPFVSSYESLAMFLWTLGGCESNRRTQNRFKHSADTNSMRYYFVS